MSEMRIESLVASVAGKQILHGIDLTVRSGEVHVIMGPNGSGKSTLSHVLMGRPGYTDIDGSLTIDGTELLGTSPVTRSQAGLFLAMQYPMEVPGVSLIDVLREAALARGNKKPIDVGIDRLREEAQGVGMSLDLLDRWLNVDMSGGERKRNETLMLAMLQPQFAVLDEIDSGLDIDALRDVARRIETATKEEGLGVLAITHYNRLLNELRADQIHVMVHGKIVASGGPELATELERTGYGAYGVEEQTDFVNAPIAKHERPEIIDVWGGPKGGAQ